MAVLDRSTAFTVLPAARLNAYADEIERLATGLFASTTATARPIFKVRRTSTTTTVSGTELIIPFQTADEDQLGMWDPGDPTRVTVQTAGVWLLAGAIRIDSDPTPSGYRLSKFLQGGTHLVNNVAAISPSIFPTASITLAVTFTAKIRAAVGDPLYLTAFQNSGGNLLLLTDFGGCYFGGVWLGP